MNNFRFTEKLTKIVQSPYILLTQFSPLLVSLISIVQLSPKKPTLLLYSNITIDQTADFICMSPVFLLILSFPLQDPIQDTTLSLVMSPQSLLVFDSFSVFPDPHYRGILALYPVECPSNAFLITSYHVVYIINFTYY